MHFGGGGVHGSPWQFSPNIPPPKGEHIAGLVPAGHCPESGIGSQTAGAPPQHGCSQYCVTPHVSLPHAKGAGAGGGAASPLAASGASHAISSCATDQCDPVHVAIEGPPCAHP